MVFTIIFILLFQYANTPVDYNEHLVINKTSRDIDFYKNKGLSVQYILDLGFSPKEIIDNDKYVDIEVFYGLRYQGGLIFYLNKKDGSGLVASTTDYQYSWDNGQYVVTNARGKAIGTGNRNTKAIIETLHTEGKYAALICQNHVEDGYDDWFLPSIDELNAMYTNLRLNNFGNFQDYSYWSSTEETNERAWGKSFLIPNPDDHGNHIEKYHNALIRPVRTFK